MQVPPLEVTLHHPHVDGQRAEFSWHESRPSGLYRETRFHLTFPESIPLAGVPARLWWHVLVMCLHAHWPLLRPCVVRMPVRMDPGAKETWVRLLRCHADTLDAIGTGAPLSGDVAIIDGDEALPRADPLPDRLACAAAFSGGKDSLAQVGLLCEMRRPPLLVTTTSPHPTSRLEVSTFRARALAEVQRRRGLELAEVTSDFRGTWDNLLPRRRGYPLSLNEMADTFLYTAALAVAAYARGATRLLLASENEVSLNAVKDGVYLQHSHFMYSALTQAAMSALMRPLGLRLGSLTGSLESSMVQELVTRRYRDLADLQCSCWSGTATSRACSECAECRRLALVSLACGGSPSDQGVDMIRVLARMGAQRPKADSAYPHPPNWLVAQGFRRQYARAIHAISPARMLWHLLRHHPKSLRDGSLVRAMREFAALRTRTLSEFPSPPEAARYRSGYLDLLDEPLRGELRRVLAQQFDAAPETEHQEQLGNLKRMIDHVTEPMREQAASGAP